MSEIIHQLISKENVTVTISDKALHQSVTLATMLADTGCEDAITIPVPSVSTETLQKIVHWCEKHRDDAVPEKEKEKEWPNGVRPPPPLFDLPKWDDDFLTVDETEMYYLLMGANYLEVTWLYRYLCKKLFLLFIKNKPNEEIKMRFEPPTTN
ncbi:hypothetical protein QR680_003873 [Steinernema hermaphroditum]|uniref:Skp1-related protein n=1 Tax=Steinernema hermaphroditum TaxID=289476 RepID=A0AA39HP63_9BILA|nr:hypothetical protein QR680_003873 [Steinernema hermaphroditum]